MLDRLLHSLIRSRNEAADDVLIEALRFGNEEERSALLAGLLERRTPRGLAGIISLFDKLSESLQIKILEEIKLFHTALRLSTRSEDLNLRMAAMRMIALGRQGRLAYVLSENLNDGNDALAKAASEALVQLARWIATETRRLQAGQPTEPPPMSEPEEAGTGLIGLTLETPVLSARDQAAYNDIVAQRPEIETAVARAMDVHRGRFGSDLLRGALLLCDWPGSKTLAILNTPRHGGQAAMVRRLQQPPASEHVDAFLVAASYGHLRPHFANAFARIEEAPVLDAMLRRTHWLKDHRVELSMHHVTRGTWWGEPELARDIDRRTPDDAARIAPWIAASGMNDAVQDERMDQLRKHADQSFSARLRILRVALGRKRGTSVALLKNFLADSDERLMRMAAREIVRRRPPEMESFLLQLMTNAPESVRRVVTRAIGQTGFDHFWEKFDRLNRATRKRAGFAMLKLLPDAPVRLARRLSAGPIEQRLKAMQMVQELSLGEAMREQILQLLTDPDSRLRSKAVSAAGAIPSVGTDLLVERLVNDPDNRVRANLIEVLEDRADRNFLPLLAKRARAGGNRERANAIKALHRLRIGTISQPLMAMLADPRPEHRVSGLWVVRAVGWWPLLGEVGKLAREDTNLRVRRYALNVLRGAAEAAQAGKVAKPA